MISYTKEELAIALAESEQKAKELFDKVAKGMAEDDKFTPEERRRKFVDSMRDWASKPDPLPYNLRTPSRNEQIVQYYYRQCIWIGNYGWMHELDWEDILGFKMNQVNVELDWSGK